MSIRNETRVNLRHLLEDIRDSYALPVEEVIVTELMANALDSGAARVVFDANAASATLRCRDDGRGMRREDLRAYHDIAATTKERGRGIGFAGIGAKLSLLVSEAVRTDTRGPHGTRAATVWRLTSATRAPWKFVPFSADALPHRGTAVTLTLANAASPLTDPHAIRATLWKHFQTLCCAEVFQRILRLIYRRGVEVFVNGKKLAPVAPAAGGVAHPFPVFLNRKSRMPVGFGYVAPHTDRDHLAAHPPGIAISTYGKIIKRGWEWLGVAPRSPEKLSGIVEIPALAEILTTNKTDFLSDAPSLKKYYRYRKAVQEALLPVLEKLGEAHPRADVPLTIKPLVRDIEETLGRLITDFPELETLVGSRRKRVSVGEAPADATRAVEAAEVERLRADADTAGEALSAEVQPPQQAASSLHESILAGERDVGETSMTGAGSGEKRQRKKPGLAIAFEELGAEGARKILARLAEDTVWINTAHPAWQRAKAEGLELYHILSAVAWTLAGFLEPDRSPQDFVAKFFSAWGERGEQALDLFTPAPRGAS